MFALVNLILVDVDHAAEYFGIGSKKIRYLISTYKDADCAFFKMEKECRSKEVYSNNSSMKHKPFE